MPRSSILLVCLVSLAAVAVSDLVETPNGYSIKRHLGNSGFGGLDRKRHLDGQATHPRIANLGSPSEEERMMSRLRKELHVKKRHPGKSPKLIQWFRDRMSPQESEHFTKDKAHKDGYMDGLSHSLIMILVMEFCDKTFFIQAIMAMTNNKYIVLFGSVAALCFMNVISCILGVVIPVFLSKRVTAIVASCMFGVFGARMLITGVRMDPNEANEEYEEAEEEIRAKMETGLEGSPLIPTSDPSKSPRKSHKSHFILFIEVFLMIFFAEWGDRSQVSTIMLAGTHPVTSVLIGGSLGYLLMSIVAVQFGSYLSQRVSPRVITVAGGALFLVFAALLLTGRY